MAERTRRRRGWTVLIGVGAVTCSVVAAAAVGIGGRDGTAAPAAPAPATAAVTRSDLVEYVNLAGTLGYGPRRDIDARGVGGTITALPGVGATITRGRALFSVDNLPVVLLYGTLPLYRPLRTGVTGDDVRELETNLAALGYHGFTVDATFTSATAAAVRRWQAHLGTPLTGAVAPAQAIMEAGAVRVATRAVEIGAAADGTVLTVTDTEKLVTADLPVDVAALVTLHASVTVAFDGGSGVPGTVASIGTVATEPNVGDQPGNPSEATVPLVIDLSDPAAVDGIDGEPAAIRLIGQRHDRALCVPVEALLALREGGFGVEVLDRGRSRIVAVAVGLFANGLVEIVGGAITEGMMVVVPG